MPITAFIGVLISWLIVARKALRLRRRLRLLARTLELADVTRLVDRRRGERGERLATFACSAGVEVGFERVERQHPDQAVADQQGTAIHVLMLPRRARPRTADSARRRSRR